MQSEPIVVPEGVSTCSALATYESTSQREPAQVFDPPSSQTDWTQDIEELLLDGGSDSISAIRSPTLSPLDPVPAPSCDRPMVDMDDDFDLDELLLRLTGHEASSAMPLSNARSDSAADLSPQLPPIHYVPMRPSPTVVSDLPLQEAAATLPPLTVSTTFLSSASLPSPDHFLGGPECPVLSPTLPSAPSLLGSGYATAEGSPDLDMESYLRPGIAFDPTKPFDWTVLAEVALPPQAEPTLITDHDGEGPPGQYERSESFEFVSPPSITASNGARNEHIEAHAWWTDFPLFSMPQPHPHSRCTLDQEQGQGQLRIIELSEVTSPQMQPEPLDEQLQIGGDMVKAQAEGLGQVAEEIQVQVTGQDAEHPLDSIQPESDISTYPPTPFVWARDPDSSQPLSPPVVTEGPGPVASQELTSPLPSCQHQHHHHQSAAKKCSCPFCASMPIKRRQRKRKAVVVNEDTAYGADGHGDMGGKRSGKRHMGEPARPRAKRTKEASGKRKGAVRIHIDLLLDYVILSYSI